MVGNNSEPLKLKKKAAEIIPITMPAKAPSAFARFQKTPKKNRAAIGGTIYDRALCKYCQRVGNLSI
jgi:hypothetical protein